MPSKRRGFDWVRNHERPETASQCEGRTRDFGSLGECSIHSEATMFKKRPKYGNAKCTYGGISFDSKKEMQRYLTLLSAQRKGIISDLELQPTFELIPKITEEVIKHLKTKDKVERRTVQRPITYTADFGYIKDGMRIIEDVKGSDYMCTEVFKLKEKLFRWKFGFSIKRIYKADDEI